MAAEVIRVEDTKQESNGTYQYAETTAVGDTIATYQPLHRKGHLAIPMHGPGSELRNLLMKAAGVEGKKLRRLVCTMDHKDVITFDVTLLALEKDVANALETQEQASAEAKAQG